MRMLYSMTCHAWLRRPRRNAPATRRHRHFDRRHLNRAVVIHFPEPRQQRMQQLARQAVFVLFIALDQSAERRAGDDAHVAVEGVFVFLVRDERINLAAADERDVPGLGAAKVFLEKDAFGIIHVPQPRPRVGDRLAQNRVNRAGRRAERILDDERPRMLRQNFLRLDAVRRDVSLRERDFEFGAKLPRKIAFALDPHRLAGRAEKMPTPDFSKSAAHGCNAQSMDCGMTTSTLFSRISGTGLGKASCENVLPTSDGGKWP